ncbi:pheromone-regulated protein prm10, partial [Tieghemiomyces parasiticus]
SGEEDGPGAALRDATDDDDEGLYLGWQSRRSSPDRDGATTRANTLANTRVGQLQPDDTVPVPHIRINQWTPDEEAERRDEIRPLPNVATTPPKKVEIDSSALPADSVAVSMEDDKHEKEASKLVRRATATHRKSVASSSGGGVLSSLLHLYNQPPATYKEKASRRSRDQQRGRNKKPSPQAMRQVQSSATLSGYLLGSPMLFHGSAGHSPPCTPDSVRSSVSADGTAINSYFGLSTDEQHRIKENIRHILMQHEVMILVARALLMFGSPSHRLESNMKLLSDRLVVDCSVANLPGLLLMAFNDPDTHTSETHMIRVPIGGYHMSRLRRTNQLIRALMARDLTVAVAIDELTDMIERPVGLPWYVTIANYTVVSFTAAPLLFGGSWVDAGVSAALGFVVGAMSLVADRLNAYANVFEVSAAVLCGLIASVLSRHVCYWGVVLSGMVNLLPGLTLTLSVTELASRNVISGSVRLFYALIVAFLIGFGLTLGTNIYTSSGRGIPSSSYTCQPISQYYWFLLFPITSLSFNLYLRANLRDYPSMLLISAAGFTANHFASQYFDASYLSPAIASFVIATLSNVYSRVFHQMAINNILAGILLLVPGSLGVKGSLALLGNDSSQAYQFALQMVIISLSVSVGLFASSLMVYPLGKKHNVLLTI